MVTGPFMRSWILNSTKNNRFLHINFGFVTFLSFLFLTFIWSFNKLLNFINQLVYSINCKTDQLKLVWIR